MHHAACQIDILDIVRTDEGNQNFLVCIISTNNQYVIRAGFEELNDSTKGDALAIFHPQTDEVCPVVFTVTCGRQLLASDAQGIAAKCHGLIAVIDTVEGSDQSFPCRLPAQ